MVCVLMGIFTPKRREAMRKYLQKYPRYRKRFAQKGHFRSFLNHTGNRLSENNIPYDVTKDVTEDVQKVH